MMEEDYVAVPQNGDTPLTKGEFAKWEAAHRKHSSRLWSKLVRLDITVKIGVGLISATFVAVLANMCLN